MVASTNADIYSPFQPPMISEDGPQSSEEGSGLHSPVFGAQYSTHGDSSFRYQHDQLDVQHPTGMIPAPQYDYAHSLNAQQPPILDTTLELPNSSARHGTFSSQFVIAPRNQLGIDFAVQSPVNSRIAPAAHGGPPIDFRYSPPTERRLPGGPSHDHSYTRPTGTSSGMPVEGDHKSSLVASTTTRSEAIPAAAEASTSTRDSRKEIAPVVIACRQCRSRKIRCDSTRPVCNNCVRRSNECEYDLVPKRRGPDKRPGTRQRSCKKRPADGSAPPPTKRKRATSDRTTEQREEPPSRAKENNQDLKHSSPASRQLDRYSQDFHYAHLHPHSGQVPPSPTDLRIPSDPSLHYKQELSVSYRRTPSYMYDQGSYTKPSYPRQLDVNTFQFPDTHRKFPVPTSPSIETEQKLWWDKILRSHTLNEIADELRFLLNNTGHLLSFINYDFFTSRLSEHERLRIQPAFIYAILAMAKLMRSSKLEGGSPGLQHAIELVNNAHAAYEDALRFSWVDPTLAEAALILALFESSAHPHYTADRASDALRRLDNLIRNITLTTIDSTDPDVSIFSPDQVPVVLTDPPFDDYTKDYRCSCVPSDAIEPPDMYINRPYRLPWPSNWTDDEIRDEKIRRLCWSALSLVSEYVAQCETFNERIPRFFLSDASNFRLLFPGEVLDRVSPAYRAHDSLSPKDSVYALYCRSMLLWNFCNRFRTPSQDEDRAEQAHEAFLEAQAIEDALNTHRCNLDTTLIYTCREYIHNTRMLVAQAFRSFHGLNIGSTTPGPIFKRKQAEDWLFYEDQVIQRVNTLIHQLTFPAGEQLTRRPFRITWFINQLAICLVLWKHDPTLDDALKLAKLILNPIDVLNELWPCPVIRQRCDSLRQQLIEACSSSNIPGPLPPGFAFPPVLRSMRS